MAMRMGESVDSCNSVEPCLERSFGPRRAQTYIPSKDPWSILECFTVHIRVAEHGFPILTERLPINFVETLLKCYLMGWRTWWQHCCSKKNGLRKPFLLDDQLDGHENRSING